jgi:hypothetical protein
MWFTLVAALLLAIVIEHQRAGLANEEVVRLKAAVAQLSHIIARR